MEAEDLQVERRRRFRGARRAVVKLGTSVVSGAGGEVSAERVEPLVRSLVELHAEGRGLVLVSSGAVGLGAGRLGLARARLGDVVVRQACAAVGQSLLMHAYGVMFGAHGVKIAQVLLTEDDFTDRRRYSNLQRTMERLLKLGVVPVVNENDTVSTAELEYVRGGGARVFSDNDRLAALVASKLASDTLARVFAGEEVGTAFVPTSRMAGKRRWIAYAAGVRGRVVVNDGAREAILRGKASLLVSGVVRVEREFEPQDVVSIADPSGCEFARGIANCASSEASARVGEVNDEGAGEGNPRARRAKVLVTRDNIVITGRAAETGVGQGGRL